MKNQFITEHFTFSEMTHSSALVAYNQAHRENRVNLPKTTGIEMNLHHLCMQLEKIRGIMDIPLKISSGYRNSFVNSLVGGSVRSLHMQGLAADVILPMDKNNEFICIAIDMPFTTEVLLSHKTSTSSTWVHFGISTTEKKQCRVGIDINGRISYSTHSKKFNNI